MPVAWTGPTLIFKILKKLFYRTKEYKPKILEKTFSDRFLSPYYLAIFIIY